MGGLVPRSLATRPGTVLVRDSKDHDGPVLSLTPHG
ncbi:DUF397 domain-containing protein [Streptomyces nitrosporeus]